MEPIETTLEFIVDDPRFRKERFFAVHVGANAKYSPTDPNLSTIKWEDRPITIHDMRSLKDVILERYGFQHFPHEFSALSVNEITEKKVEQYQLETEHFLKEVLKVEKVICYDYRFRRNGPRHVTGDMVDINHPLLPDLPPRGAHNITFESGPQIIKKVLEESRQTRFLNRKYRFRIVNTWRPLVPRLEDRPLAICDFRTVDGNDFLASDQIYARLRTEIYYLQHNPAQRWYWLSHQTSKEVMLMLMYDTRPKTGAKFCPHVSFENPNADPQAPRRESVETRSVVISLASEDDCGVTDKS